MGFGTFVFRARADVPRQRTFAEALWWNVMTSATIKTARSILPITFSSRPAQCALLAPTPDTRLLGQFAIRKGDKIMSCVQRMVNCNPTFLALRLLPV